MYYPFLRGKQNELLALRRIAPVLSTGNRRIHPIIEPVKDKSAPITKAIGELVKNNIQFTVILNPSVGDLVGYVDWIHINILQQLTGEFCIGILINRNTNLNELAARLRNWDRQDLPIHIILKTSQFQDEEGFWNFIENHSIDIISVDVRVTRNVSFLSRLRALGISLVLLDDCFNKQKKNADYEDFSEEFFSEDHLLFEQNGYSGFSDYVTIGEDYMEGGFQPYAVVIHLTYFDSENRLMILHFVSDSNDDPSDRSGKFMEALHKLIPTIREKNIRSIAVDEFISLYDEDRATSLGSLKKLSVLHHLDIMNRFLND